MLVSPHLVDNEQIKPFSDSIKSIYQTEAFRSLCKELNRADHDYGVAFHEQNSMQGKINWERKCLAEHQIEYADAQDQITAYQIRMADSQAKIERLISEYNLKLGARHFYDKMKAFVQELCSWLKPVKEVKDIL